MSQGQDAKVLLMGKAGAGKTSMKSIIFANYHARDTKVLHQTNLVEYSSLRFLGNLRLNLWDCGGQDQFMENYFESQRENIFQNAEVLIYVLVAVADKTEKRDREGRPGKSEMNKELEYFRHAMDSLRTFSPHAKVFCLVHKLDLLVESKKMEVFNHFKQELQQIAQGVTLTCFATSIWDESLFKAWSDIVRTMIPDVNLLEAQVKHFCEICKADEVVLFEKNTFLLINTCSRKEATDNHRFEKISNIVKQFKLSCGRVNTHFRSFKISNHKFTATIQPFLEHSFVMIVTSDPNVKQAAVEANLSAARRHFLDMTKAGAAFGVHL